MSRKTSPARRAAFLRALRETGNQTIAAERAKVSRSWVQLHRATDPQFKAEVAAAVAEAKASLSGAAGRAPPAGWGHLDGEELVVKGTNGRRVQIARARLKQWTPRVEDRFLQVLTATCNVKAASAEVGLTQASAYLHRQRWPAFAARWDKAIAIGAIQLEFAMVRLAGGNVFSSTELPPLIPMPPISLDDGMQSLYMTQHKLHGLGGRPGREGRGPGIEEASRRVLRCIDAIKGGEQLGEAEIAAAEEEYARRRPVQDWEE